MEPQNWNNQNNGWNNNNQNNGWNDNTTYQQEGAGTMARSFMANTFGWMTAGLLITALLAWVFGTNLPLFQDTFITIDQRGAHLSILAYVIMFSPLLFVMALMAGIQRFPLPVLMLLFIAYSAVTGISLSFIFMTYTHSSIFSVFLISAGMFAAMAIIGYTTKTDLTKFGSILMMMLIGILIASVVNWFMHSEGLYYLISYVGVAVFAGLTAWDVQKLKRIGAGMEYGNDGSVRLSILGAVTLYMDFINLFLFLLRILGDRKS